MFYCYYLSPMGEIAIAGDENGLAALAFVDGKAPLTIQADWQQSKHCFTEAIAQLDQYFAGARTDFDLKLAPRGTAFQQSVWRALMTIPHGATRSYQQLASNIGKPSAVRAVGTANGANPIAIIIPCHRVIASNGKLSGYAGGIGLKAKLLMLEGAHFKV